MKKIFAIGLGFLAATSFASVRTIKIPAVPDRQGTCSFVVESIPEDSTLKNWNDDLSKLVGKTYLQDTTFSLISNDSADTLKCNVATGKRPTISIKDTTICLQDSSTVIDLITFDTGTYLEMIPYDPSVDGPENRPYQLFTEKRDTFEISAELLVLAVDPYINTFDSILEPPVFTDTLPHDISDPILLHTAPDMQLLRLGANSKFTIGGYYQFLIHDSITGCESSAYAQIELKDCDPHSVWINYNGPKEYYESFTDDYYSHLSEDSIYVLDPFVDCICPLPLDTFFVSTQSEDTSSCDYYKFDVKVMLSVNYPTLELVGDTYIGVDHRDTIVAYVIHIDNSEHGIHFFQDTVLAGSIGNCTFVVPPVIRCDESMYTTNMNIGDTITNDCDLIYTFKNYCTGPFEKKIHIIVPDKDEIVKVTFNPEGAILLVYTDEKKSLLDFVTVEGKIRTIDWNTGEIIYVNNKSFVFDGSFAKAADASSDDDFVYSPIDSLNQYLLDEVSKSGLYRIIATDTLTGCKDGDELFIYVKDSTDSAPLYIADVTEKKGDIYTVSGSIVMKNVYLKDVMDRLKEGLYIFNNRKIFIRKD